MGGVGGAGPFKREDRPPAAFRLRCCALLRAPAAPPQRSAPAPAGWLSPERRAAALDQLLERVTSQSGITLAELRGAGRRRPVVAWRRITAYAAMTELGASAAETGRLLRQSTAAILKAMVHAPRLVEMMKVDVSSLLP